MHRRFFLLVVLGFFGFVSVAGADDVYVNAKSADIVKDPRKNDSIKSLPRGTKLEKLREKSDWLRVSYRGTEGWIYKRKVLVGRQPTADASLKAKGGSSNLLAGEVAAGSAIRGLSPLAQKFSQNSQVRPEHRKYTDYHQSFLAITPEKEDASSRVTESGIQVEFISSDDLKNFLSEGGLGEYGAAANFED